MCPKAQVSANRIMKILNEDPTIKSSENGVKEIKIKGGIEFDNVSFTYPNGLPPKLRCKIIVGLPTTTIMQGGIQHR